MTFTLSKNILSLKSIRYLSFSNYYSTQNAPTSHHHQPHKPKHLSQNQFYFKKSPILTHIDQTSEYSRIYQNLPVVILLGWTGSRDNQLRKFQSIYTQLGYHVIRFAPSDKLTFIDTKSHTTYAYKLLDMMKNELKLEKNPIIVHQFSNAGLFVVYHHILKEITKNNGSKSEYDFFKSNHKAAIFDSGPGWPHYPWKLIPGIADLLQSKMSGTFKRYVIATFMALSFQVYHYAQLGVNYFTRAIDTVQKDVRQVPTIVFFSYADKLIAGKDIERLAEQRVKANPGLYFKKIGFADADHVLIYAKYAEEYVKHIKELLDYCKLNLSELNLDIDVNSLLEKIKENKE